ncbi:MAG: hypothetical protein ACKPHU_37135, partial [Planctomycetaceae bacterium]
SDFLPHGLQVAGGAVWLAAGLIHVAVRRSFGGADSEVLTQKEQQAARRCQFRAPQTDRDRTRCAATV